MSLTTAELAALDRLVTWALEEDLGDRGDLTSQTLLPADLQGQACFLAREAGVVAGVEAVERVFAQIDPTVRVVTETQDAVKVAPGARLVTVEGPIRSILTGERAALNFLQRLSGVATLTRRFVDLVADLPCQILDTRKTTPGWRLLQKYAVRCGGGHNHRMGLHDGVIIKDNHLAALGLGVHIGEAVSRVRERLGPGIFLEIEVDDLDQLDQALAARPDVVLLDNMPPADLREAVHRRSAQAPGVLLEASGGVSFNTVRTIAETGVDRISVGALTHSAPALDIGLDYEQ